MPRGIRIDLSLLLSKIFMAGVIVTTISALGYGQTFQTGIPPFASVDGGPDSINLADNSVHWSFPIFSRAGRGIPLSFELVRDTTGWGQQPIAGGTGWFPLLGDYIPGNSSLAAVLTLPTCTDGSGAKHTYTYRNFSSFQDLQGNSHPLGLLIQYSNVPSPRGTCPTAQTTVSGMVTDGSGITVTIGLTCPGSTTSSTGCASLTATLRDGSVMSWPSGGSPTWTDSNGNRITYNFTSGSLSSITDTLGTTALTYSYPSGARNGTYTSPAGVSATVTMLFQQVNW
jgi:hypothetical protein